MLFRSRRRTSGRLSEWAAFAGRLELLDASDQAERLRRWLDLGEGAVGPVYGLKRPGQPSLYLFDQTRERSGPTGTVRFVRSGVLLRWHEVKVAAPLRAMPRRGKAMEAIEAGRTGSKRLDLADLERFDAAVSVFARDEVGARSMLTPPVREVIHRLLAQRGGDPSLVVGDEHFLVLCNGAEAAAFDLLEGIATDLMTLYAVLVPPPGGPAG